MKSNSDKAKALALAKRVKQLIDPDNTWSHKGPLSSLIYVVRQLYGIKMMPRVIKARNASRKVERELVKALNVMITKMEADSPDKNKRSSLFGTEYKSSAHGVGKDYYTRVEGCIKEFAIKLMLNRDTWVLKNTINQKNGSLHWKCRTKILKEYLNHNDTRSSSESTSSVDSNDSSRSVLHMKKKFLYNLADGIVIVLNRKDYEVDTDIRQGQKEAKGSDNSSFELMHSLNDLKSFNVNNPDQNTDLNSACKTALTSILEKLESECSDDLEAKNSM